MTFLRMFQHLLPNARAWRITATKQLRQFFDGLTGIGSDFKTYVDNVWLDIFPETTREITEWESQFGLLDTGLSEQERRDRLDASWKASGGQHLQYIQDTLQGAGFNVFVHEWFEPGTEPGVGVKACVTPRNPNSVLRLQFTNRETSIIAQDGVTDMQDGHGNAIDGRGDQPIGYPLVNKLVFTVRDFLMRDGVAASQDGGSQALDGLFGGFKNVQQDYIVPSDPAKWPYFLYIGGENFPDSAQIQPSRRDEFETLCLKICPAQQWLGILVQYL